MRCTYRIAWTTYSADIWVSLIALFGSVTEQYGHPSLLSAGNQFHPKFSFGVTVVPGTKSSTSRSAAVAFAVHCTLWASTASGTLRAGPGRSSGANAGAACAGPPGPPGQGPAISPA